MYIYTCAYIGMYVYLYCMNIFFFRELIAKHLPSYPVSNLSATPAHFLGPGLCGSGILSSSAF